MAMRRCLHSAVFPTGFCSLKALVDLHGNLFYTQSVMYVWVIANQKGGVGKTTLAANLGAALAARGVQTLLVDLDPQGALTSTFGLDPYKVSGSVVQVLAQPQGSWRETARAVRPGLFLLPAHRDLLLSEYQLLGQRDRVTRLKQALPGLVPDGVQVVCVDTPPSLGILTANALVAGTHLLVPVAAEYLAMRGVRLLLEAVRRVQDELNPTLRLLALVPTKVRLGSVYAETAVAEMRRVFGRRVARTWIPMDESVAVAPAARQTVLEYRPESPAAQAFRALADELWQEVAHV